MLWLSCSLYEFYRESSDFGSLRLEEMLHVGSIRWVAAIFQVELILTWFFSSFPEFFAKAKNWMEMVGSNSSFRDHINKLELSFNTNFVLIQKLEKIFADLFRVIPNSESPDELVFVFSSTVEFFAPVMQLITIVSEDSWILAIFSVSHGCSTFKLKVLLHFWAGTHDFKLTVF